MHKMFRSNSPKQMSWEDLEKLVNESEIAARKIRRERMCLDGDCPERLAENLQRNLRQSTGLAGQSFEVCFRPQGGNILSACEKYIRLYSNEDAMELKRSLSRYFPEKSFDIVRVSSNMHWLYMQMPEARK